jgi:hypothetical protein
MDKHSSLLGPFVTYTRLNRLARDKHYSFLYQFISYEENEVL